MAARVFSNNKITFPAMLAIPLCIAFVGIANAQPVSENDSDSSWRVDLGIGAGLVNQYSGSRTYKIAAIPLVDVTWKNRVFVSTQRGIGFYAVNNPSFQLGASFGYSADARYYGGNGNLRGLPSIKPGGLATIFAEYRVGGFSMISGLHQRIGAVNGESLDLGAAYDFTLNPQLSINVGPSITYASASLNDGFYGVTAQQSTAAAAEGNHLRVFRPGAGIQNVALNIDGAYQWNEHWTIHGIAKLSELVGQDGNSPVTQQKFQPAVAVTMNYRF